MNRIITAATMTLAIVFATQFSEAKTVRYTEMSKSDIEKFTDGKLQDTTIEFRQGDELPLNTEIGGDLFEAKNPSVIFLTIKRNFWLKIEGNNMLMSLNGQDFKNILDMVGGSIMVGAGQDQYGNANSLNLIFKTALKK